MMIISKASLNTSVFIQVYFLVIFRIKVEKMTRRAGSRCGCRQTRRFGRRHRPIFTGILADLENRGLPLTQIYGMSITVQQDPDDYNFPMNG
jgi:hypothetical protein